MSPSLSSRDLSIQTAMPVLVAPVVGELPPVELDGVRHVVTRRGLVLQARTQALDCSLLMAPMQGRPLPYGDVADRVHLTGPTLGIEFINQAIALARAALPNEWAGCVVWRDGAYALVSPAPITASPGRISYSSAGIDPSTVVLDIHSHGTMAAGFSGTDDADDRAQPSACFLAAVIGHLHREQVSTALRLVINGRFVALDAEWLS